MKRWCAAGIAIVSMALFWLIVLPWIGQQAPVREHVDRLHAADINASAMFYTELECQQWLKK